MEEKMEEKVYLEVKKFRIGISKVLLYGYTAVICGFIAKFFILLSADIVARSGDSPSFFEFFVQSMPITIAVLVASIAVLLMIKIWIEFKKLSQD